ncbi:hypothetical protein CANCADRAFT_87818 [Tortispora caseinolytica NRRL Y-17796]|uniref:Uncharacterized protein n=1 Tax=Tortispora caseinolytica NRRL Y-17796 TaxID=767744 RepID=A0A1E4TL94_9ASCO|nr:hypothetical protein CANCADRAFT_87818 [Tortispora caseinolytica NRRL Y-17796]
MPECNKFSERSTNKSLVRDWAYPVPSALQNVKCMDMGGTGYWDKRGVWRCILPGYSEEKLNEMFNSYDKYLSYRSKEIRQGKDNEPANADIVNAFGVPIISTVASSFPSVGEWFDKWDDVDPNKDGDAYLKAMNQAYKEARGKFDTMFDTMFDRWDRYYNKDGDTTLIRGEDPGVDDKSVSIRGQRVTRESHTQDDGSIVTHERIKKWYSDGTSSESEVEKVIPASENRKGGWFWS